MDFSNRWKWGETCPIAAPAAEGVRIHPGDLLYLDKDGKARPARQFKTAGDLQEEFAAAFLGVALTGYNGNGAPFLRCATRGTFEFKDESDREEGETQRLGDLMGIPIDVPPTAWSLAKVDDPRKAIARISHVEKVKEGKAIVSILSTVICGGVPGTTAPKK